MPEVPFRIGLRVGGHPVPLFVTLLLAAAAFPGGTGGIGGSGGGHGGRPGPPDGTGTPSGPWWRRRQTSQFAYAKAAALEAKDAAGQAFYELDRAQREMGTAVRGFAALDDGPASARAIAAFAAVNAQADEAVAAYLATLDRHDPELDPARPRDRELPTGAYETARTALLTIRDRLQAAHGELERFGTAFAPERARLEAALAELPVAVDAARRAVAAAGDAVSAAAESGLRMNAERERLRTVQARLDDLEHGMDQRSMVATLAEATAIRQAAEGLRTQARELPARRDELLRRLTALRTRAEAVESKSAEVEPTLSALRRKYSESCWRDLRDVPQQVGRSLSLARARLAEAGQALGPAAQDWTTAVTVLSTARAVLQAADEAITSVRNRLRELDEVARDPSGETGRTRFVIKDAQRLVMAGPAGPEPRYAAALDALVFRMEAAEKDLGSARPDYWRFLTEMRTIRDEVAEVVRKVRADRAGVPRR